MNHGSVHYSVSKKLDVIYTVYYSNDFHYTVLFFFSFFFQQKEAGVTQMQLAQV